MENELITWRDGSIGRLRLNRPRAINALTPGMITGTAEALTDFEADPEIVAIAIDGAGERGLCSGADVRAIRGAILEHGVDGAAEFWRSEYAMNAQIAGLNKPYAAFMDGIVMGGGVGISTYGTVRVTTPRTRLAMPETGIGLFPDVGTMYTLSRAPKEIGTHMAMTGAPVTGGDAVIAGFADAVIDPHDWEPLLDALRDGASPDEALDAVKADRTPPADLAAAEWIAECYTGDDPAEIIARLRAHTDPDANAAGELIASRSPLSVAVTLAALRRARDLPDLAAVLDQDLRLAMNFTRNSDFLEGVRAVLVDKDNDPKWSHDSVADVSEETIEAFFQ